MQMRQLWTRPGRRLLGSGLLLLALLLSARPASAAGAAPDATILNVQASHFPYPTQPDQLALNPTNPRNLLIGVGDNRCNDLGTYVSFDGGRVGRIIASTTCPTPRETWCSTARASPTWLLPAVAPPLQRILR
jgi:hypothetical protein